MKKYKFNHNKFINWIETNPTIKANSTYHETFEKLNTLGGY